jgi:hypothetical protein
MSENSVTLSFNVPNTHKKYADQIIDLVNEDLLVSPALEHMYEVEKRQHSHTFSFADIDDTKLESFFAALNAFDARNVLLTCWFSQVDETQYYAMIRGRLLHFDTLEDYREAVAKKPDAERPNFDFGRQERDDTLLVRLRVKGKKRQRTVLNLFSPLEEGVTDDGLAQFEKAISAIKNRDNEKRLRCEEGTIGFFGLTDRWYDGPKHLMKAFVFVNSVGDYIYLGFDMRRIGWEAPVGSPSRKERTLWTRQDSLENLIDALGPVFFVSDKSWAKYRPNADNEVYAFLFEDESQSTTRPVSADDEWNLPG